MQRSFLSETARKLYERYGRDISSLTIVFPSRRARLFFSDALSQLVDAPLWQPKYISMDDIMSEASSFASGDKVRMITELYKIYSSYHDEPFDKFYFWGEMLLGDFDLIDKYMIDADMLFRNICDLKELEADLSYLTPEMRRVINSFWSHFADEASLSDEKRKFLSVWLTLAPIYHRLRERLTELRFAYTGMIYRSAVENVENGTGGPDTARHYVFIGFNALSECEKRVLKYLDANARCDFFWDYDSYYTDNAEQEAGRFLRENIRLFPPADDVSHDNFIGIPKKINAISTVSNVVQCKYVPTILRRISPSLQFDKQTAIVLTDESLLLPLLHSLPSEIADNINVTMGYPLRQTTAYSFVERLIELQKNRRKSGGEQTFYHADASGILLHPYLTEIADARTRERQRQIVESRSIRVSEKMFADNELLGAIFTSADNCASLSEYLLEAIQAVVEATSDDEERSLKSAYLSIMADNIRQLNNSLKLCDIEIGSSIYTSLLKRHLQTVRIPFDGEPLKGLQVMGILETRNLDFRNVVILSMNDDNFPGNLNGASSFIPYNLRAAYGMPTPEHHEGVYAYYFYRLIQRAENVDMLYCSHADEKSTGEQSRYIYQLRYESPYDIGRLNVGVDVAVGEAKAISVEKRGRTLEKLERFLDADDPQMLSPTALARYIACPLKFYFAAIARLKVSDEISEEVDNPMFGTILHAAMQRLYGAVRGVEDPVPELERMQRGDAVEKAVVQAINDEYLNNAEADPAEYAGSLALVKSIVTKYIRRGIIPYDTAHGRFSVMDVEHKIAQPFELGDGRRIVLGGIADRIDSLDNGRIRVVDYKTGDVHLEFNGAESLFEGENRSRFGNLLQTMIYSMVLRRTFRRNVEPALYFVRYIHNDDYDPHLIDKAADSAAVDYDAYAEEFETLLRRKLDELFDPETPFAQCDETEADKICKYCDFKLICKR